MRYIYTGIAAMLSWYYSSSAVRLLTLLKGCQVAFHKCGINLCVLRTLLWLDRNFPLSVDWDFFASLSFIMTLKRDSRILLQGLLYYLVSNLSNGSISDRTVSLSQNLYYEGLQNADPNTEVFYSGSGQEVPIGRRRNKPKTVRRNLNTVVLTKEYSC